MDIYGKNNVYLNSDKDVDWECASYLWEVGKGLDEVEYICNLKGANKEYALMFLDMMEEDFNAWCIRSNN